MPRKKTVDEFIYEAQKVHGEQYDYSKVEYLGNSKKVVIICREHGEFLKSPEKHIQGQGCRECNGYIKLDQISFEKRAIETHGRKYNYSKSVVKKKNDKVIIICSLHGEFEQLPGNHIKGQGCPMCAQISRGDKQRYSLDKFISSVKKVHGDKYDYSHVDYLNSQSKIEIICPIHGSFIMKANSHSNGQGCPTCGRIEAKNNIALDYSLFIERAIKNHGAQYIYDESSYKNYTSKMRIECSIHGWFEAKPHAHISMKSGCPSCGKLKRANSNKKTWNTVSDMFKTVHGTRYLYDENSYFDVSHKMRILCEQHGWFEHTPAIHYLGHGCKKCGFEENAIKKKIDFDIFIAKSIETHGKRYDYSNIIFTDIFTPINIICSEHGSFLQTPRNHYRGSGCPKCNSSRGENAIRLILNSLNVEFSEQKTFSDLKHKKNLKCDFYLPSFNSVIEYNGLQHYEPISVFGGIEGLIETQRRDTVKYNYLTSKGIKLIIIRYDIEDIELYLKTKLKEFQEK